MNGWYDLSEVPDHPAGSAVTIGVFDGVHLGHAELLRHTARTAVEHGLRPLALTFEPHPLAVLRPTALPELLTPLSERATLLRAAGMAGVVVLPFDAEMASWSPRQFAERVLRERLSAKRVVVGEDFRFGARAAGDVSELVRLGAELGFEVEAVGLLTSGGSEAVRVSSSIIRTGVVEGDVGAVAELLGRPYRLTGPVVRGDQRGRELGYPTANLELPPGVAIPADGIYAGWLSADYPDGQGDTSSRHRWPAAISIGTNPTFDGTSRRVEAYALDRDDLDLYDRVVQVDFVARLRPTLRFGSVEELVDQMAIDVDRTRVLLANG